MTEIKKSDIIKNSKVKKRINRRFGEKGGGWNIKWKKDKVKR